MRLFRKSEDGFSQDPGLEEVRKKILSIKLPSAVDEVVSKELSLLGMISPSSSEYTIGITYITYLASLPWNNRTEDTIDIQQAKTILDNNHYGLEKIKERILEYLAVRKLKMDRKPSVLVVDNEEIARRNIAHVLGKEDYSVRAAANGAEALKALDHAEYNVILTDLKMAGMDGMEVLEKVKARHPHTEVIMMTGYATIGTAVEAMKRGAFHYISKPLNLDEVKALVAQAVSKHNVKKGTYGSVLCFAGPPGTGKTSLGRAIAQALGRRFGRVSLGGIRDEADIRGHRRTYAGAMPGRIIEEIRRAGTVNPLIILDEVDKMGHDAKGDPASALLEALDPEQNTGFMDHYLDIPFDLSDVIFIITANVAHNLLDALRDRMEVIEFTGYTLEEKAEIALQFLVPRQIQETGLFDFPPSFHRDAIVRIVQDYTWEAGIRSLNREIGHVCRRIALDSVASSDPREPRAVTPDLVAAYLGPRKYHLETAGVTDQVGITTGLVWTEVGGDIISIEVVKMKGKQELILTGSLGNVMRESAQAGLSYVRSNTRALGIPEDFFEGHDIHVHVPAGAISKDGPSAGAAIALALISLLTGRSARRDAAMSAELTLSGRLLPVGGVKEKVLAARRAQIRTVILPSANRVDVETVPDKARKDLDIVFVENMSEVIDLALTR